MPPMDLRVLYWGFAFSKEIKSREVYIVKLL